MREIDEDHANEEIEENFIPYGLQKSDRYFTDVERRDA